MKNETQNKTSNQAIADTLPNKTPQRAEIYPQPGNSRNADCQNRRAKDRTANETPEPQTGTGGMK